MPHNQQILDAIERNDYKTFRTLISDLIPNSDAINALNPNNETYFHVAAKALLVNGGPYNIRILELLLEKGINSVQRNKQDATALEMGNVDAEDKDVSSTPLLRAIAIPLPLLFKVLLNSRAKKNKENQAGIAPVCEAAAFSANPDMLRELIKVGGDIFVGYGKTTKDFNPLELALHNRKDPEYKLSAQKLDACISILLDNFAAIGFSFIRFEDAITNIDFTDKILLGAEIDEDLIKLNPTLTKSIRTIEDLDTFLAKKAQNPNELLDSIKQSCLRIKEACRNKDMERYDLVTHIHKSLEEKKWSWMSVVSPKKTTLLGKISGLLFHSTPDSSSSSSTAKNPETIPAKGPKPPG